MTERQAIESTYFDKFTIYRRINQTDPLTKITSQREELIAENISCAISQSKNSINQDVTSTIRNSITLFTSPNVNIKAGDKIIVNCQSGQIKTCISADPFIYSSHMEVALTEEGKA